MKEIWPVLKMKQKMLPVQKLSGWDKSIYIFYLDHYYQDMLKLSNDSNNKTHTQKKITFFITSLYCLFFLPEELFVVSRYLSFSIKKISSTIISHWSFVGGATFPPVPRRATREQVGVGHSLRDTIAAHSFCLLFLNLSRLVPSKCLVP